MSTTTRLLETGDRVQGTYFGVPFSGEVTICLYSWGGGCDSIHVKLDEPIMVNDVERTLISHSNEPECGVIELIDA
jgi:hypothetical protein